MSKSVRGTIYTLVAGTAWGLSGTSGQYLMVHGFSALSLTNFRLLVAGLALMGMAYFTDPKSFGQIWKDKQSLVLVFSLTNTPFWRLSMRQRQEQQRYYRILSCGNFSLHLYQRQGRPNSFRSMLHVFSDWGDFLDCHSWSAQSAFYDS